MSITSKTGSTFANLQSLLDSHTSAYQKSMEQLSSGHKYSSTGENPLAVSKANKIDSQIQSNKTADSNISLGEDMLSMAEEYQENVISNISRIRDLCTEAANGTYSASDKDEILNEIKSRLDYLDKTAASTKFNDINILDGSASTCTLQVGSSSSDRINVGDAFISINSTDLGINIAGSVNGSNWTQDDIAAYVKKLSAASDKLVASSSKIGAYLYRVDTTSDSIKNINENLLSKKSGIMDADVAEVSAELVQNQILQNASVSILTQVNNMQSLALSIFS